MLLLRGVVAAAMLMMAAAAPELARALEPGEALADPALEFRARAITRELRCLVCQNQSIDDSNAELARDLRRIVRERIAAGEGDPAVLSFVTARYGDFVLLRPPFNPATWALWLGPAVILAAGGCGLWRFLRRRQGAVTGAMLSADEERRIAALLDRDRTP